MSKIAPEDLRWVVDIYEFRGHSPKIAAGARRQLRALEGVARSVQTWKCEHKDEDCLGCQRVSRALSRLSRASRAPRAK